MGMLCLVEWKRVTGLFDPEDEGTTIHQNVGNYILPINAA
jgi:hypothetical protein